MPRPFFSTIASHTLTSYLSHVTFTSVVPATLLASSLLLSIEAQAASDIERAGDVLALTIPAVAYGSTYYMDDKTGRTQFYKAFAANVATTYALKTVVDKERPDGSDNDSFPSGHTALAFGGASFIHKRYGLEYSIPAYVGAAFVGYSRVHADKHDTTDVLAGAAIGGLTSFYVTPYERDGLSVAPNIAPDYYGFVAHYEF